MLVLYIVGSPGGLSAGIRKIQVSFKRSRIVSTHTCALVHTHTHMHVIKTIVINMITESNIHTSVFVHL